jgi:hypothetical protein
LSREKASICEQMYRQMRTRAIPGIISLLKIGQPFGGYFLIAQPKTNQKKFVLGISIT